MKGQQQSQVYVTMMLDSLKKKESVLSSLVDITKKQDRLLSEENLDADEFDTTIDQKEVLITQINELDDGFERLYSDVKSELEVNRENYRKEIQMMQRQIGMISDLSVKIQTLENRNSEKMKKFLAREKDMIRSYHINNRTAATYYQNMANVHREDKSYFLNEKK